MDSPRLLKITACEKSVYFVRLHFPRATRHPGSARPTGPSLHFSRDLHLIPSLRTRLDSTWAMLLAPGRRPGVGFDLFGASSSCLNLTDFLILKAASDPDSTTSFMFVPGFFLFLRTPKQEQSFRDRRLYMMGSFQCQDSLWLHCWTSETQVPLHFPSSIYNHGKSRLGCGCRLSLWIQSIIWWAQTSFRRHGGKTP